jgi:hypothetical protein
MSKMQIEKADDQDVEMKVYKLRNKIITEDMIRKEVENRRKLMRKMMQQKNGLGNAQLESLAAGKNTVVKDSDGHIIETGIFDMIESKGMKVTYDSNGNLIIIKQPRLKTNIKVGYNVKDGE